MKNLQFQNFLSNSICCFLLIAGLHIHVYGQKTRASYAGVWVNTLDTALLMTMYPNGKKTMIVHTKSYYLDDKGDKVYYESKNGMVLEKDSLMSTSGPYQSYGMDGYFLKEKGKTYYLDWFFREMGGGADEPRSYLYEKVAELPANWVFTMDDRVGEEGVINKAERYVLARIDNVQRSDENSAMSHWVFYYDEDKEFRIPVNSFSNYPYLDSLVHSKDNDPKKLIGEKVKIIYRFNGYAPGYNYKDRETGIFLEECLPIRIEAFTGLKAKQ